MSKGKERLVKSVDSKFKAMHKNLLELVEIVVPKSQYPQIRKKILNITNDVRRDIANDVELNYKVDYDPATICEDVVVIGKGNFKGKGKNGK